MWWSRVGPSSDNTKTRALASSSCASEQPDTPLTKALPPPLPVRQPQLSDLESLAFLQETRMEVVTHQPRSGFVLAPSFASSHPAQVPSSLNVPITCDVGETALAL